MNLPISVIIPTMNRPDSLNRTLSFIDQSDMLPQEIIVVDQSTERKVQEENQAVLKRHENTANTNIYIYIYQQEPSLTKARNNGFAHATQDIIVFSDDDVDVERQTFSNINKLMQDEKMAMIGGFSRSQELGNSLLGYFFFMSSYRKRRKGHVALGTYGKFPITSGKQISTEWAMGFFFAVKRNLMLKWHILFDERLQYYAYAEDLDFTYGYYLRCKEEGLKCIMSDLLTVTHNVSQEYRMPSFKSTVMGVLHREYIQHKYHSSLLYRLANLWANIGMLLFRIIKRERPTDFWKALCFLHKYRKDVLVGNFHYSEFM